MIQGLPKFYIPIYSGRQVLIGLSILILGCSETDLGGLRMWQGMSFKVQLSSSGTFQLPTCLR